MLDAKVGPLMPKYNCLKTFGLISIEEFAEEFDIKVLSCNFAKKSSVEGFKL